jgi:hypothetical protein
LASGPAGYHMASNSGSSRWIELPSVLAAVVAGLMALAAVGLWCWIGLAGAEVHRYLMFVPWGLFFGYFATLRFLLRPDNYYRSFFYAYRSVEIGNGVSPIVPLMLLSLALAVWSFVHLQRAIFFEERYQRLPKIFPSEKPADAPQSMMEDELQRSIEGTLPVNWFDGCLALVLSVVVYGFMRWRVGSLEGIRYDRYYALGVGVAAALLCLTVLRFWRSWRLLRRFLEQLELHPIRYAFSALPKEYSWSPIWQHSPRKRNYLLLSRAVDCLRQWQKEKVTAGEQPSITVTTLQGESKILLDCVARSERIPKPLYEQVQNTLTDNAKTFVSILAGGAWSYGSSDTLDKAERQSEPSTTTLLEQEFVALRFVAYIRYVMLHLKNLLTFIVFGYVLVALSLGSYPFDSPHMVAWILVAGLFAAGLPIGWVFLEMERDATLSRIMDTKPGEVEGFGFYTRIASAGALPLLSVLASHFPSIGQYVFSWVQPLLRTLH